MRPENEPHCGSFSSVLPSLPLTPPQPTRLASGMAPGVTSTKPARRCGWEPDNDDPSQRPGYECQLWLNQHNTTMGCWTSITTVAANRWGAAPNDNPTNVTTQQSDAGSLSTIWAGHNANDPRPAENVATPGQERQRRGDCERNKDPKPTCRVTRRPGDRDAAV
jgi:hypothetical protein